MIHKLKGKFKNKTKSTKRKKKLYIYTTLSTTWRLGGEVETKNTQKPPKTVENYKNHKRRMVGLENTKTS